MERPALILKMDCTPGVYIGTAREQAQRLADRLGCWVEFIHGDKTSHAIPAPPKKAKKRKR
jgi:hypothetical protein